MRMALDEPKPDDIVHTVDGFTFVLDKDLSGYAGEVTIHATYQGFEIHSGPDRKSSSGCSK